jgi:outer membrane protein assembly factor BamB
MRIDRETGRIVWDRQIAVSPIEPMHRDNTAASATPATDGKNVYVVFVVDNSLQVQSVDFDGKVVWTKTVGGFAASHGFCTSLVLQADSIYLSGLQDGPDAFVARMKKDTGEVVWKVPRSKAIRSYSTPYLCNVRGTPAVLLSGAEQTIAYDRATGKTLWEIEGPGSKTVSSLVINSEDDMAYVCGGRDNQFFAIDLQNVNRASADSPQIVWSARKGIPYMTSPLLTLGRLHILSDEGVYSCFDPKTGELLLQRRVVGAVKASMVANQQYIYITESSGRTTVINNGSEWNVVSENDLGEPVVASPAISNGDLIIRGEQHLYLIRNDK